MIDPITGVGLLLLGIIIGFWLSAECGKDLEPEQPQRPNSWRSVVFRQGAKE